MPCPTGQPPRVAAGAALLSSGLTGALGLLAARRLNDAHGRNELAAALQAYGYATDLVHLEIGQLPPDPGQVAGALQSATARLPTLDHALGQMSRRTLGRAAQRVLDAYLAAFNRLLLVAPASVLDPMETINGLLSNVERRHEQSWAEEWSSARGQLTEAARAAMTPGKRLPTMRTAA